MRFCGRPVDRAAALGTRKDGEARALKKGVLRLFELEMRRLLRFLLLELAGVEC